MKKKRRDDRSLCADLLKLRWKSSGKVRTEYATLEDICPSGACLQVDEPIPAGTTLTIIYPGGKFLSRVKYCNLEPTGYFIGVEFVGGYRWSRRQYDPAHLLLVLSTPPDD